MSAAACLRVIVDAKNLKRDRDVLAIVARVTGTFLETRWSFPRRFSTRSPTAYVLTDPRASTIDPREIQALAGELQRKLFGAADTGEVSLLVLEGAPEEVARFAAMPLEDMRDMLTDPALRGRVMRVTPQAITVVREGAADSANRPPVAPHPADSGVETRAFFRGVYLAARQEFIGSIGSRWRSDESRAYSVLDGANHFPTDNAPLFDEECARTCVDAAIATGGRDGLLFLPLSYSSLIRRSTRTRYAAFLSSVERLPRERLVASIYDVPRDPSLAAFADIRAFLQDRFSGVNLMVSDAAFRLENLPPGSVHSVTIVVPHAEDVLREAALKRFGQAREIFRHRQIWPMASNVRTQRELALCAAYKIPFVSGRAVTDILEQPIGMLPYASEGLPLHGVGAPLAA